MIEAAWDWLTGIPVAIWSSIITGTVTLAGVVLGQYLLERQRERQKEEELDALRDSLAVELRAYDDVLKELLYVTYDIEKLKEEKYALTKEQYSEAFDSDAHAKLSFYAATGSRRSFSDEVYRSNADKIGELKPVVDRVDELLGSMYGLSEKEVEYVQNYDTEYGRSRPCLDVEIQ